MITQADVNKFLNEFGINNNLMEKLIKESVDIGLKENIKLKQALTEIKEFFNEECELCKANYVNITDEICEECKYNEILQKCEVLDEHN